MKKPSKHWRPILGIAIIAIAILTLAIHGILSISNSILFGARGGYIPDYTVAVGAGICEHEAQAINLAIELTMLQHRYNALYGRYQQVTNELDELSQRYWQLAGAIMGEVVREVELLENFEELNSSRHFTETDIDMLSQTVFGEARGTTPPEWVPVIWTVLQRVDSDCNRWPNDIKGVIVQHMQFHGFNPSHPVDYITQGHSIRAVVIEELEKWMAGEEPPILYPFAPTVPYFFFRGDYQSGGGVHHNWFRSDWR